MTQLERYFIRNVATLGILRDVANPVIMSNYFSGISQNASDAGSMGISGLETHGIMINVELGTFNDATAFNTWLDNNTVYAYYVLGTPSDEEITDATLISQLNALLEGGSYNYQTNIVVSAADPNLPGLLQVTAAKWQ